MVVFSMGIHNRMECGGVEIHNFPQVCQMLIVFYFVKNQ